MGSMITGCRILHWGDRDYVYVSFWNGYHYIVGDYRPGEMTCNVGKFIGLKTVSQAKEVFASMKNAALRITG